MVIKPWFGKRALTSPNLSVGKFTKSSFPRKQFPVAPIWKLSIKKRVHQEKSPFHLKLQTLVHGRYLSVQFHFFCLQLKKLRHVKKNSSSFPSLTCDSRFFVKENQSSGTSSRDLIKDTLPREKRRKKPSTRRESNPQLQEHVLYHCATTTPVTQASLELIIVLLLKACSQNCKNNTRGKRTASIAVMQ